jgi:hypothetical protein
MQPLQSDRRGCNSWAWGEVGGCFCEGARVLLDEMNMAGWTLSLFPCPSLSFPVPPPLSLFPFPLHVFIYTGALRASLSHIIVHPTYFISLSISLSPPPPFFNHTTTDHQGAMIGTTCLIRTSCSTSAHTHWWYQTATTSFSPAPYSSSLWVRVRVKG